MPFPSPGCNIPTGITSSANKEFLKSKFHWENKLFLFGLVSGSQFQVVEISKYISEVTRICYLNSEVSVVIAYYAPNRYMFLVYRNIRDSADMSIP